MCILDAHQREFHESQYAVVDLSIEHSQDNVQFVRVPATEALGAAADSSQCVGQHYRVLGLKLGSAVVTVSATVRGGRIYSEPLTVQVLPPVEVEPAELTLVPGLAFFSPFF